MPSHAEKRAMWESLDWTKTNYELAAECGHSWDYVRHKRYELKKPQSPRAYARRDQFTPTRIACFALKKAGHRNIDIARILGVKNQTVDHALNRAKRIARTKIFHLLQKHPEVKPKACQSCHKKGIISAHHEDYNKPFDVRWLCTSCHWKEHSKEKYRIC